MAVAVVEQALRHPRIDRRVLVQRVRRIGRARARFGRIQAVPDRVIGVDVVLRADHSFG